MTLAWLHADCLTTGWCPPGARAIYIFDDAYLAQSGWGLKRLQFVYETLLELPVEIHRGRTAEILRAQAATRIVTVDSPDPWLREQFQQLPLEVLPSPAFVELSGKVDLKRFSRYWAKAEGKLLA